jgi:hypothetical protein
MSNIYDSDIPEKALEWLYDQEETFVIFKRWYGTQLATGGDLPARLWQYFKIGKLKAYLDHLDMWKQMRMYM